MRNSATPLAVYRAILVFSTFASHVTEISPLSAALVRLGEVSYY